MDAIKQAEEVLADHRRHSLTVYSSALYDSLTALLTHAKAQAAELSRLKEPLGDEGKSALVEGRAFYDFIKGVPNREVLLDLFALIEHQAAALAQPVPEAVEALVRTVMQRSPCRSGECGRCWACQVVHTLRILSRANTRLTEGVAALWTSIEVIKELAGKSSKGLDDFDKGARTGRLDAVDIIEGTILDKFGQQAATEGE